MMSRTIDFRGEEITQLRAQLSEATERAEKFAQLIAAMDAEDKQYESMFSRIAMALGVEEGSLTTFESITSECERRISALAAQLRTSHAAWEAERLVAELTTGREFDIAMKFVPMQIERDELAEKLKAHEMCESDTQIDWHATIAYIEKKFGKRNEHSHYEILDRAAEEMSGLAAQVARLLGVLDTVRFNLIGDQSLDVFFAQPDNGVHAYNIANAIRNIETALAATPAQCLAAVRAEALREAAVKGWGINSITYNRLHKIADHLETAAKEATDGK